MSDRTERHIEKLRAAGGGRLEIRLLEGNREKLASLAEGLGISRERWINEQIERAWTRLQRKLLTT